MIVLNTVAELKQQITLVRSKGEKIGFVPTMGALHKGHISLVDYSVKENDVTVVSIFVNPTQFNNPNDLSTYPRVLESDLEKLKSLDPDFIFIPSVEEIYPEPDTRVFDFGDIDKLMEGKNRPGHFNGVAQVVSRLFDIVTPDKAYFGKKDFQQVAVIKQLVKEFNYPIEIVACPIIREDDGLAMSSRNMLLSVEGRKNASKISEVLNKASNFVSEKNVKELKAWVINEINSNPFLVVEYFEIVDDTYLKSISSWNEDSIKVACITVQVGNIRLIDNIIL